MSEPGHADDFAQRMVGNWPLRRYQGCLPWRIVLFAILSSCLTSLYLDSLMTLLHEQMLARAPPFRLLDPQQLRDVLVHARISQVPTGGAVFGEGEPADRFHLLVAGHVCLLRITVDGDEIIVLYVAAGEVFGLGAPLGTAIRQETAVAADDCMLLSWPAGLWQVFATCFPKFGQETMRSFGARSEEMGNRIVELSSKQVEQRIACALLRLIGQFGHKVARGVEIRFPLKRQNVADMTGSTLHTVSRTLSGWEKLGIIESARCHIVVTNPHRLVLIANGSGRTGDRLNSVVPLAISA